MEENASVTLPASVTIADVSDVAAAWTVKSPATAKIKSGKLDVTAVPADTQVTLTVTLTKDGYNAKTVEVSLKRKAS